ncbi:hypothetical protein ACWC2K_34620 [Streptomyces chattanoogensis]|uniref:hypothetical protein n=1 Tax=Streptomyces chattanoogensis TaxID=66876 RepID=UPI0036BECEBC
MTNKENWLNSLKGRDFMKGSTGGLGEMLGKMLLGWRSLFLGCCGTVAGFVGAITNSGLVTRVVLLGIGSASLVLTWLTLKHMKRQQDERNKPQR